MSNVRPYTDQQIFQRIADLFPNKITLPDNRYTIIGVQSTEDAFNEFDDKFYVFKGKEFILVTSGTTNPGSSCLLNFTNEGAAIWKTNEYYSEFYIPGYHRGRMKALRQSKPVKYYRDSDRDKLSEQQGQLHEGIIYVNFHGCDYDPFSKIVKKKIAGWSYGCMVCNNMTDYRNIIAATWKLNKPVDYALLKEWDV